MTILIKLFQNSKLDLIQNVKFVKQLFRIQIKKGGQVSLWNQVKSKMEACYSELGSLKHGLLYKWTKLLYLTCPHEADLLTLIISQKLTQYL